MTNKTHTISLKDFPGNPVLPKKLFQAEKKAAKGNTKNYLPASFFLSSKAKKPPVVDIKVNNPKGNSNKRTTRIRTKGEKNKKLATKVPDDKADKDESENSLSSNEEELEELIDEGDLDKKIPNAVSKIAPKEKVQTTLESFSKKEGVTKQNAKANRKEQNDGVESSEECETSESLHELEVDSEEEPSKSKSTRATSGKRHVLSDTISDDAPKKKKRATKQESEHCVKKSSNEDEGNVEHLEEKPVKVKVEEKSSALEETTVDEDTSVVLNVKRKGRRRR